MLVKKVIVLFVSVLLIFGVLAILRHESGNLVSKNAQREGKASTKETPADTRHA